MDLGTRVRDVRKSRKLSQEALAREAGVSLNQVNKLERGVITDPHYSTLSGIARALDMTVEQLVEEPALAGKAEAPEVGPSNAEQRLPHWLEALQEQIMSRADKHGDEVEDENSPHFASANAATLWLAQVEDELAMWQDFSLKQTVPFLPERRTEGWRAILDVDVWGPWFEAISPLIIFDAVIRDAKRRIEGMQDKPDELAVRRLEKATTAADESRARVEELRRAAGEA